MLSDQQWKTDTIYTPEQVEQVLIDLGVEVVSDTFTHWLAYCPFHGNSRSPAMVVDKESGLFYCNNPSCDSAGSLESLVKVLADKNQFEALRFIIKRKGASGVDIEERLRREAQPDELPTFPQHVLDRMYDDFWDSPAHDYMKGRGFEDETLEHFRIGYSKKKNMVGVPMHDSDGNPIGLIGRSIESKRFKNSNGLPKAKTAWNIHRAKPYGSVVVCEASFDAMRIHQAGYPNVVALLGGHISNEHVNQLGRYFSEIILMTDYDKKEYKVNCRKCRKENRRECRGHRPGRELANDIAKRMSHKKISWAAYDDENIFPHGAKDASDMTDEEIRTCVEGRLSRLEYEMKGLAED